MELSFTDLAGTGKGMTAPQRVQRRRVKGWRMPANTVYVGRGSPWGNPWHLGTPAEMTESFQRWIAGDLAYRSAGRPPGMEKIRSELRGKNLACWCKPDARCHADVLLHIANNPLPTEAQLARANRIIGWMAPYIGSMCPPPDGLYDLNEHCLDNHIAPDVGEQGKGRPINQRPPR